MLPIFDFGISQEDALVEQRALDINDGDSLLCVSSAGEIPLNLLALSDIKIKAVDISVNQNHLTNLKFNAIRSLEPMEAASFLGFIKSTPQHNMQLFQKVTEYMDSKEKLFWNQNLSTIENGSIHSARFEKYIKKFNGIALRIIGKRNMYRLFELSSIAEQEAFFDKKINSFLLKKIFQGVFHPRIYKKRGISSEGLIYSKYKNISEYFFDKFKAFCCSTLARKNYYLQFTFFNQVLFPEALPEYLTEAGTNRIRKNYKNLEMETMSYIDALIQCDKEEFNKYHLSNIGDWMDKIEFADLLRVLQEKSTVSGRINSRFIYYKHPVPDDLKGCFIADNQLGEMLSKQDRYPFYGLVPIKIDKHSSK